MGVEEKTRREIGNRLDKNLRDQGFTEKETAAILNLTDRQVERIYSGECLVTTENLLILKRTENVNPNADYILFGESMDPETALSNLLISMDTMPKEKQREFVLHVIDRLSKYCK